MIIEDIFTIGKNIAQLTTLYNSDDARKLAGLVGKRVYPVLAPQETLFPYITYSITDTTKLNTKDGMGSADVTVLFTIASDKYKQVVEIATMIDKLIMKNLYGASKAEFASANDAADPDNNAYLFQLSYTFTVA